LIGEPPTRRVVGIQLECDENERKEYVETVIPLEECNDKSEYEICKIAYKNLKVQLDKLKESIESYAPMLGSEFVPEDDV